MIENLYKPYEVAQILRISKALTYKLMAQGDIPTIHFSGKTVRVRQSDLAQFIQDRLSRKESERKNNSQSK